MTKIELLRVLGDEVCEGCNDDRDCGVEYSECPRLWRAGEELDEYVQQMLEEVVRKWVEGRGE